MWIPTPAGARLAPDRNGVIHACYGPSDGEELHIIGAQQSCPPGKVALNWDQRRRSGRSVSVHVVVANRTLDLFLGGTIASDNDGSSSSNSLSTWIGDAVPTLTNALLLFGLGMLAVSIALVPFGWLVAQPARWPWLWRRPIFRWLGPALQIQPFEDSAMASKLGTAFALLAQARVGGGREGMHLYLVTGEQPAGLAVADIQGVPQTQALAAALSLLRLTWRRRRLVVSGSLMPVDDRGTAAVALSLRRNSKFITDAELWPSEPPPASMSVATSNRVLAVAAAGWIEHTVVDQTPGPQAREVFLSHEARSWALFRAGAEMNRISRLHEAADFYEKALAIDGRNIGALVDLAHLRRRDDKFEGAEALAIFAVDLIEERNCGCVNRKDDDDPNWYRAQIVLATIHASWADDYELKGQGRKADTRRDRAYDRAVDVARRAMAARDKLERIIGQQRLEDAARGARIGRLARRRARRGARAEARRVGRGQLEDAAHGARIGRLVRLRARRRARAEGRRFDLDRAVELYQLLETTFEPGALLLVATNCRNRAQPPPEWEETMTSADSDDGARRKAHRCELKTARTQARSELQCPAELDPRPVIEYVRKVPLKSPRVAYNLACHYSVAARGDGKHKKAYRRIALEYLRQCISRSPPLERRGLLRYAQADRDLHEVRQAHDREIRRLWRLVPGGNA